MATDVPGDGPHHGFRGGEAVPALTRPRAVTVAISREVGARGSGVATALGRTLGWPVFPQEMLDFLAREDDARAELLSDLPAGAVEWAGRETERLIRERALDPAGDTAAVVRLVHTLAARGEAVLVGRGAGFVLPRESTIHVRVVADRPQRVAYLAQWLRLGEAEAEGEVDRRDEQRVEFLRTLTDLAIEHPANYHLVINSHRAGVEATAEVIATLVRGHHSLAEPRDDWGTA